MKHCDKEIVSAIKLSIAERIGSDRFETWFRNTRLSATESTLRIYAAHEFALNILRNKIRSEIEGACIQVLGVNAKVEFGVDPSCSNVESRAAKKASPATIPARHVESNSSVQSTESSPRARADQQVGAKRRFLQLKNFVAGQKNAVAISSADHVAANPGIVSPLFLYGPTGTGKSHLAEGIWCRLRRTPDRLRCVYLSAEQFTSYFLQALNGSGLPSFRQRYRHVDLLVIEDVQFFAGKRATIVELQHTVDSVLRDGKQLILTADRAPGDLGALGEEMVNRFAGGLVIRVESPDREARLEILRQKARELHLEIPEDVVEFIADHLKEDVRKLQGALNRLSAVARATGRSLTMDLASSALKDIVQSNKKILGLGDIEQAVCEIFELTPKNLKSSTRSRRVSHPRMLAMALARKHTRAGLSEIGDYFGNRSHATVISAAKKVESWQAAGSKVRMFDQECPVADALQLVERRLLG